MQNIRNSPEHLIFDKKIITIMDLSDLLNTATQKSVVDNLSSQLGISSQQTGQAIEVALPVLLGALGRNAQTPQGAQSLDKALESKHDGSLLGNLSAMLGNNSSDLLNDGNGILGHIFGNKKDTVEQGVAQKTGLNTAQIGKLLALLAPIVMAYLGKQKRQKNVSAGGLGDLLGGLLGGSSASSASGTGGIMDTFGGFLDKDGDGDFIDDLAGMFGKK
ncbi:MAG TPA: hypothetical protein DEG28_06360 [Porphyromonadaceae bacterium]|nr:hypothetical protein [Porphyromonadaceae bacterium]